MAVVEQLERARAPSLHQLHDLLVREISDVGGHYVLFLRVYGARPDRAI